MKTLVLFLTIFFAVFFANLASNFATTALVIAGIGQVADELQHETHLQLSSGLAKDIELLNAQAVVNTEPFVDVRTKQQQRAFENDARLCKSWQQMYLKDGDELSKMHRDSACKRANSQ
jgi:hypothetical protein